MNAWTFGIALILFPLFCRPQNPCLPGQFEEEVNVFQKDKISAMGVRKVKAEFSYKFDLQVIRDDRKSETYLFNQQGLMIQKISNDGNVNTEDEVFHKYIYSGEELVKHVRTDKVYHSVLTVDKPELNTKIIAFKLLPVKQKLSEGMEGAKVVWRDSISTEGDARVYYNEYKLNYKRLLVENKRENNSKTISIYQPKNKLNSRYIYLYDEAGRISSISVQQFNEYLFDWKKEFDYGAHGLVEENYFKEGKKVYNRRITYNDEGLPIIDLKRNEETKKMTIVEYKYSR